MGGVGGGAGAQHVGNSQQEEGFAMCFRPNTTSYDQNLQMLTCPNCGELVAVQPGVTEGTCPNCKCFVSEEPNYGFDPNQNYRVL